MPALEDFEAEDWLGADVATYFHGKDIDNVLRLSRQKLAFELMVSEFGGREELDERFYN